MRDAEEIKSHPFFRDVDWTALAEKRVPPPFKPPVLGPDDCHNFMKDFLAETPSDSSRNGPSSDRINDIVYEDFTYERKQSAAKK